MMLVLEDRMNGYRWHPKLKLAILIRFETAEQTMLPKCQTGMFTTCSIIALNQVKRAR
jgi:hypothetical protein